MLKSQHPMLPNSFQANLGKNDLMVYLCNDEDTSDTTGGLGHVNSVCQPEFAGYTWMEKPAIYSKQSVNEYVESDAIFGTVILNNMHTTYTLYHIITPP